MNARSSNLGSLNSYPSSPAAAAAPAISSRFDFAALPMGRAAKRGGLEEGFGRSRHASGEETEEPTDEKLRTFSAFRGISAFRPPPGGAAQSPQHLSRALRLRAHHVRQGPRGQPRRDRG